MPVFLQRFPSARSGRMQLSGFLATALFIFTAACQDSPTQPNEPEAPEPALTASSTAVALAGRWTTRADYPVDVFSAVSAAVISSGQSTLYVIGGRPALTADAGRITDRVRAYSTSSNTWRNVAPYPIRIQQANGAVEIGGKIYVSGGNSRRFDANRGFYVDNPVRSLYVYNPGPNSWTRKRDMPTSTVAGLASAYQGRLYLAASCASDAECNAPASGGLWRYNPATDRWTLLSATPHHPSGAGGFIGGKLYVVGQAPSFRDFAPLDIYDLATGHWSSGPHVPLPGFCDPPSTTLAAKLYLVGCPDANRDPTTLVFDPKVSAWTKATRPPALKDGNAPLSRVVVNGQSRLELVGGTRPGNNLQFIP
jgi:N-acetylneuraminic acid mutarotase